MVLQRAWSHGASGARARAGIDDVDATPSTVSGWVLTWASRARLRDEHDAATGHEAPGALSRHERLFRAVVSDRGSPRRAESWRSACSMTCKTAPRLWEDEHHARAAQPQETDHVRPAQCHQEPRRPISLKREKATPSPRCCSTCELRWWLGALLVLLAVGCGSDEPRTVEVDLRSDRATLAPRPSSTPSSRELSPRPTAAPTASPAPSQVRDDVDLVALDKKLRVAVEQARHQCRDFLGPRRHAFEVVFAPTGISRVQGMADGPSGSCITSSLASLRVEAFDGAKTPEVRRPVTVDLSK